MITRNPYVLLKLNRLLKNHSLKCLGVVAADLLGMRHLSIRLDPALACNLRCQMCHFSSPEFAGKKREIMPLADYERIASLLFPKSLQLVLGCSAEPTLHPQLPRMVEIAKRLHKVPFVGIATNAQLLTESLAEKLLEAGLDEFTVSMHGVEKETYERLQPPASYEKLHRALAVLTDLAAKSDRSFKVRINYTVNPSNQAQLVDFFQHFGQYKIDLLQVRKIFDLGNTVYQDRDLAPFLQSLSRTRAVLQENCHARKTTLLCPPFESETGKGTPASAILLPLVLRYASPEIVWKRDFPWRTESYEAYCKRTGWRRSVLAMARRKSSDLVRELENGERSLGYDVD